MDNNLTALMCAFAKAYHYKNNRCRIFNDNVSENLLTVDEYNSFSYNLSSGISFFNPGFIGTKEESLRWIMDNQISPSILGRSIYTEKSLETAVKLGCKQYLIYASGYDTFAYRNKHSYLKVFEIDKESIIDDKIKRVEKLNIDNINYIKCDFTKDNWIKHIIKSEYNSNIISFNSLLGISYYLTKEEFSNMIKEISNIICEGSSVIFDYPTNNEGEESTKNRKLASGAGETMKARYSYKEIEDILTNNNLYIYEHLNDVEMTNNHFITYNTLNPNNRMKAPKGVNYCLAIKRSN